MNVRRHEESGTADAAKESPLPRIAQALAVFLAALAVTVRPMCSDLGAPLHRNILVYLLVFMSVLLVTLRIALRKRVEVQAGGFTVAVLAFFYLPVAVLVVSPRGRRRLWQRSGRPVESWQPRGA